MQLPLPLWDMALKFSMEAVGETAERAHDSLAGPLQSLHFGAESSDTTSSDTGKTSRAVGHALSILDRAVSLTSFTY
jgi:hypothetical protein